MAGTAAVLDEDFLTTVDADLQGTDDLLASAYPGDDGRRQPVHTVYVPADRYTSDLPRTWGQQALALVDDHGGMAQVCRCAGLDGDLADDVAGRVHAKLDREPIEDLRVDFEDGYGVRGDAAEDTDAVAAATQFAAAIRSGAAGPFTGIRFKSLRGADPAPGYPHPGPVPVRAARPAGRPARRPGPDHPQSQHRRPDPGHGPDLRPARAARTGCRRGGCASKSRSKPPS